MLPSQEISDLCPDILYTVCPYSHGLQSLQTPSSTMGTAYSALLTLFLPLLWLLGCSQEVGRNKDSGPCGDASPVFGEEGQGSGGSTMPPFSSKLQGSHLSMTRDLGSYPLRTDTDWPNPALYFWTPDAPLWILPEKLES